VQGVAEENLKEMKYLLNFFHKDFRKRVINEEHNMNLEENAFLKNLKKKLSIKD
jgi:hypothetical protein